MVHAFRVAGKRSRRLAIHSHSSNSETLNVASALFLCGKMPDLHHFRDFLWCGLVNVYLFIIIT